MKKLVLAVVVLMTAVPPVLAQHGPRPVRLGGEITAIGRDGISLLTPRGDVRVSIDENTRISKDGRPARLADLAVGDHARVVAIPQREGGLLAKVIAAFSEPPPTRPVRLNGKITAVERGVIGLETRRGDVRVAVTPETRISRNGRPAELGDLEVGDLARVLAKKENSGFTALTIAARGRG